MDQAVDSLAKAVQECADFLQSFNEKHWSSWLTRNAKLIRKLDFSGVEHLLSVFGGMGSINDLVIAPINGHQVEDSRVSEVNEQLRKMLTLIYSSAKKLYYEEIEAIKLQKTTDLQNKK